MELKTPEGWTVLPQHSQAEADYIVRWARPVPKKTTRIKRQQLRGFGATILRPSDKGLAWSNYTIGFSDGTSEGGLQGGPGVE
jgi:hypothetical protein